MKNSLDHETLKPLLLKDFYTLDAVALHYVTSIFLYLHYVIIQG